MSVQTSEPSPTYFSRTRANFTRIFTGEMDDEQTKAVLVEMADRGECGEEILQVAYALKATLASPFKAPPDAIDVCGTGGDHQNTVNISTAVALVATTCGVPVVKHGNRAASSLAGGADTLEELGLNIAVSQTRNEQCLREIGIAFLFAPQYYPLLARLAPLRKALGRKTILNMIGPLANPANVSRQLIGVPNAKHLSEYWVAAKWIIRSGNTDPSRASSRIMIVSGDEGLDELSISGPSQIRTSGFSAPRQISPADANLPCHSPAELKGGDARHNAAALRRVLNGEPGAYRDAVLLNSAAALMVADRSGDFRDGAAQAADAIDSGRAKALLDRWIAFCA